MTTETLALTFTGGLAAVVIPKRSATGASESTAAVSSLMRAKRLSILPSTRCYDTRPDERIEVVGFLWHVEKIGDIQPLRMKSDSFSNVLFNIIARRLIWLSLRTWGKLSQRQLLAAIGATGSKPLESSLSAQLDRGVHRGVLNKSGEKRDAVFQMRLDATSRELQWRLPFEPSPQAIAVVKQRARDRQRAISPDPPHSAG